MNEKKEVQEAKRLIQEGKIRQGIDSLFSNGYVKEALEEAEKIVIGTRFQKVIKGFIEKYLRLKTQKLSGEIKPLELEDEIGKISRNVNTILDDYLATTSTSKKSMQNPQNQENITVESLRALANQGKIQELLDILDTLFEKNPHFSYAQTKQNLQFALGQGGIHPNQMEGLLVFLGSNEVKKRLA